MTAVEILMEAAFGCLKSITQIALIVIGLMIFIEIFKDLNWLDKLTRIFNPLTRIIHLPKEASLPLMAGLVFGISYGGGIIINSAREGTLTLRDIYIINLFLVICHSIFEDTLLFMTVGAKWLPILLVRMAGAVVVCYLYARLTERRHKAAVLHEGNEYKY